MLGADDRVFTHLNIDDDVDIKSAKSRGDWHKTYDFLAKGPGFIKEEVRVSQLRGRGGGGFFTAQKWDFFKDVHEDRQRFLIVNADEGEPGTCKDRAIMRAEPHKVIEGALCVAAAINAKEAFIYVRGEFVYEAACLRRAIAEAEAEKLIGPNAPFPLRIQVFRGAGAYICGEESALIESMEGKKGQPRFRPPFPATSGLYGMPTLVQNVETVAVVPTILRRGGAWFASIGRKNNTGVKVFCLSGHVRVPCVVEEAMGICLQELIDRYGGGPLGGWENLSAVIPGGSSCPMISAHAARSAIMDYDDMLRLGSFLGTGGVIVINKSVDVIEAVRRMSDFYAEESCGQCSPCREGVPWMARMLHRIEKGEGAAGDIDQLHDIGKHIAGHTICAFGEAAFFPIDGLIRHFRKELEARVKK